MKFCVVGGMNLDVNGQSRAGFRLRDSNPGSIGFSAGGVGRNIAAALSREGHEVSLITALTDDLMGGFLAERARADGIDLSCAIRCSGSAPAYMSIHAPDGDMLAAVNDMDAMMRVTPEAIKARRDYINGFDAVVCEANLSAETLRELCENAIPPIIADAVSAHKCARLLPVLPCLSAIKLNLLEAKTISGEDLPKDAGQALLRRGVRCALVSLGSEGVYACDKSGDAFLTPQRSFSCQTTGAGDAMCAGLAIGIAQGFGAIRSAALGMEAAQRLLGEREA